MPAGRPSKYKPEYAEWAEKLCKLGATNEDLARAFEVDAATVDRWMASKAEFCGAIKAGRAEADANVGQRLYERATGYSHPEEKIFLDKKGEVVRVETVKHYPPDATSMIFWLKNRRPDLWRDKQEMTHGISDPLKAMLQEIDGRTQSLAPAEQPGMAAGQSVRDNGQGRS